MSEQENNERNSVKILALAAESYVNGLDELSKNFVGPQVAAAVQIISGIIAERYAPPADAAGEAETPSK